MKRIAKLYAIEDEIRGTSVAHQTAERQARAGPLIEQLKTQLDATLRQESRKSSLAKAIHYSLSRWDAFTRYLGDGLLEIDNSPVEREIRPVALGRKNYLFAGSDSGGHAAAMLYGLLNTAKLNGLDLEAYLRHVLSKISDHPVNRVDQFLPWTSRLTTPSWGSCHVVQIINTVMGRRLRSYDCISPSTRSNSMPLLPSPRPVLTCRPIH